MAGWHPKSLHHARRVGEFLSRHLLEVLRTQDLVIGGREAERFFLRRKGRSGSLTVHCIEYPSSCVRRRTPRSESTEREQFFQNPIDGPIRLPPEEPERFPEQFVVFVSAHPGGTQRMEDVVAASDVDDSKCAEAFHRLSRAETQTSASQQSGESDDSLLEAGLERGHS